MERIPIKSITFSERNSAVVKAWQRLDRDVYGSDRLIITVHCSRNGLAENSDNKSHEICFQWLRLFCH